jgi:uncharacterized membrane protein
MRMILKRDTFHDLAKTVTFAILHFGVGFAVSYAFTGSVAIAGSIALVEPAVNTFVFYWHERAWKRAENRRTAGSHEHGALVKAWSALKQAATHTHVSHAA